MGYYRRMYRTRRRTRYGYCWSGLYDFKPHHMSFMCAFYAAVLTPFTLGLSVPVALLFAVAGLVQRQNTKRKRPAPVSATPPIVAAPAPAPAEPPVIRRWERVWGLDGSYEDVLVPVKR